MIGRVVAKASANEVFQALAYGALKARAARIASNHIIRIGKFDLMVAEDENGDGQVVQAILSLEEMQFMALAKALEMDSSADRWSESERRQWLVDFWDGLAQYLAKWQGIRMRRGPGENITFEKAVSR
jgi:hypothetical protein